MEIQRILFFVLLFFLLSSCREKLVDAPVGDNRNVIYISSQPQGAFIILSQFNTNKVTPDSLVDLPAGTYFITLRLNRYADTTVALELKDGAKSFVDVRLRQLF